MKHFTRQLLLLMIVMVGFVATTMAKAESVRPINPDIVSVAEGWVKLVDNEQYEQAWQGASNWYRSAVANDEFLRVVEGVRKPFGKPVSRSLWRESAWKAVKGRADGNYYYVVFNTVFEKKSAGAFEHVLLEYESGQWKVGAYSVR